MSPKAFPISCSTWPDIFSSRLALIGVSKEANFAQEKPTIEYNVQKFQESLAKVLAVTSKAIE